VAKSLEALTKAQTLAAQYKHSPVSSYCDALQRVLELILMFTSLATAQLTARAEWMEAAAAAAGHPGGVPVPDAEEFVAAAAAGAARAAGAPGAGPQREPGCAEVALRQMLVARAAAHSAANAVALAAAAPAGASGDAA